MRPKLIHWLGALLFGLLVQAILLPTAFAGLIKLAESGDSEPDGSKVFFQIGSTPTLNELGQVIFYTDLRDNGFLQGWGLFLADANGGRKVARTSEPSPDLNGNFYTFNSQVAQNSTSAIFETGLQGTLGNGSDDSGLYRLDGNSLAILARAGQPAPGSGAVFRSFQGVTPRINRSGQTAFRCQTSTNPVVLYVSSTSNVLTQVAFLGQTSPDGNGYLLGLLGDPELNNNGKVAFVSTILGSSNNSGYGVFMGDANGFSVLVRAGQVSPDGNGQISLLPALDLAINDANQVAFVAHLAGTSAGQVDDIGLYRASFGELTQLARKSQLVPGGNGRFLDFGGQNRIAINNAGLVAFLGNLTGTPGGNADNAGIFLANGTNITQVVRKGQTAPDGNGIFSGFRYPALNNNGEVAFVATLSNTEGGSTDNQGIYFVDSSLALRQVIRAGQLFNGKTIAIPAFLDGPNYGGLSGFNDSGQLAISCALNGNNAVFLWNKADVDTDLRLLSLASVGSDIIVTFQALGGTTNFVQAAPSPAGPFVDVGRLVLAGAALTRTNFTDADVGTNSSRFYRIRQLN